MTKRHWMKWGLLVLVVIAAAGMFVRYRDLGVQIPEGIASGNGRIEATEVDISTKLAGRLAAVFAREGDMVEAGRIMARMDTQDLTAQLRNAEAGIRQAQQERLYAAAMVDQRKSELSLAKKELERSRRLYESKCIPLQSFQRQETATQSARAALTAAQARLADATAAIDAVRAKADEIQTYLDDCSLKTPLCGRVLYRLAEPGEVLPAGGKILTVLDITDVYMTIFLPTSQAGRVDVGADARIVLDALPGVVIPAKVSFVAAKAQFTPKDVETRTEREKLMFRVKVKIDSDLLRAHAEKVKTGLPGVAYVRFDPDVPWPQDLQSTVGGGS